MSCEDELTEAFLEAYQRTGKEVGYWGTRFLQAATAKRMLQPRSASQRQGLDVLLEAGKPELTVEAITLEPRFRDLFTVEELAAAEERLGGFTRTAQARRRERQRLFPDDLEPGRQYTDGAIRGRGGPAWTTTGSSAWYAALISRPCMALWVGDSYMCTT
jgi:hypothetical protein